MDKPYFRHLYHPELENPVFVEGLPGFGNVGKIAARLLIEFTQAKPFAELYSPSFPDYVVVDNEGLCRPPRYEFHAASTEKNHFIILTGDTQPALDDLVAHYGICGEILDFIEKFGCRLVVTIGGVPTPEPKGEVYVAATSPALVADTTEKGASIYSRGRIIGATGLLLGLTKARKMKGICLLGATTGLTADREAGFSVFKFLTKILKQT
ncbi:MAG: PAC2 family protein [Candidatus Bathyarchaeota archaeon]|nr:MAG: PAC2 family protein [Candidatus Bathyarchaeota archaeon]